MTFKDKVYSFGYFLLTHDIFFISLFILLTFYTFIFSHALYETLTQIFYITLLFLLITKKIHLKDIFDPITCLISCCLITAIISNIHNNYPLSITYKIFTWIFPYLLAKIVISYGKISPEKLSYSLCLAVLVLSLVGVIADLSSIEILFGKEIFEQGRFSFTMGGCNRAAFYLSSSLLILFAINIKSKETGFLKNLVLYYLPFTTILYALILTAEKKSIYLLPFFFITFILLSKKYKHFIFLLITFGIILCFTNIPDRLDISNISLKSSSATARLKAWEISYHLIKQKPIIGHGYGSFTERSRVFFNQNKSKLSFAKYKPLYCAHNIVLDTLTEIGFIGLIFVISIFMFVLVKIFKESNPNDFIFYVGLIIIFIFLETFVGSFTRSFHRTNYSFFIIGICIGFLSKQNMNLKKDISII